MGHFALIPPQDTSWRPVSSQTWQILALILSTHIDSIKLRLPIQRCPKSFLFNLYLKVCRFYLNSFTKLKKFFLNNFLPTYFHFIKIKT